MIKRICLSAIPFFISFLSVNAQVNGLYDSNPAWNEKPVLHKMPEAFKDASAVYLMDNRIFQR